MEKKKKKKPFRYSWLILGLYRIKSYFKDLFLYDVSYDLGNLFGNYFVSDCLPTLDIDFITTNRTIPISNENRGFYEQVSKLPKSPENWDVYISLINDLKKEYLPNPLVYFHEFKNPIKNQKNFKEGFISALWVSDACSYDLENCKIEFKQKTITVTLTL